MYFDAGPRLLVRAARQTLKAINRGDADAALRWSLVFERQLSIALRLADLDPGDRRLRRYAPALAVLRHDVLQATSFRTGKKSAGGRCGSRTTAQNQVDHISNIDNTAGS